MKKISITVLAALTLVQPVLSATRDKPGAKPSSFVPHPHTSHHVYGTPLQPAIMGHRKTSHHPHGPKKSS